MKNIIQEGPTLVRISLRQKCHTACFLTPVLTGSSSEGLAYSHSQPMWVPLAAGHACNA